MKRLYIGVILLVGCLLGSLPLEAQQRWTLKGSVGLLSTGDFVSILGAGFATLGSEEGGRRDEFAPLVNPTVELSCNLNRWLSLGAQVSIGTTSAELYSAEGVLTKSCSYVYPSLMINANTQYRQRGKWTVYGSWGVGMMVLSGGQIVVESGTDNTATHMLPMWNVYPLCFSRGEHNGFVIELGWGSKGIVNIGGYWRF